MSSHFNEAAAVPAALSAFLRGVERRGALFAELQCGDRDAGDTALAAALRAFRNHAAGLAMAEWPRRFWVLLVATPQLRQASALARWPPELRTLAPLEPGVRLALLLRLAASLSEQEAATVLGIDLAAYEQALTAACPVDSDGRPDAMAWRALAEAVQQQLRDLPPERLARLARLREQAIAGTRAERPGHAPTADLRGKTAQGAGRRRWPWIVLVTALCMAALAATWWWPQRPGSQVAEPHPGPGIERLPATAVITVAELPAQPPAARFDATTALLTHQDFELVMDPEEEAMAQEADFHAWYAAGTIAATAQAVAPVEAQASSAAKTGEMETADAQL